MTNIFSSGFGLTDEIKQVLNNPNLSKAEIEWIKGKKANLRKKEIEMMKQQRALADTNRKERRRMLQ